LEIQIQKDSSRCILCNQSFAHEQKHYSLLKLNEDVFLREDYCEECWPKSLNSDQDGSVFSRWQTKYRDPAAANATPEGEFMPLLRLFYDCLAGITPDSEALGYICALVLRRQKIFKFLKEEKEDSSGKTVLVFHDKYYDVQVKVPDPNLTETQFREVKQKLEEHLSQKDKVDER
jgi:hypothetical protein